MLADVNRRCPATGNGAAIASWIRVATRPVSRTSARCESTTAHSSPPSGGRATSVEAPSRAGFEPRRATRSPSRRQRETRRRASRSSVSAVSWPSSSFIGPNRSRSTSSSAKRAAGSRRVACSSRATCARRATMPGSPASGSLRVALGHVVERAGEQRRAAGAVAFDGAARHDPAEGAAAGADPVLADEFGRLAGQVPVERGHQRGDVVGVDAAEPERATSGRRRRAPRP